MRSFVASLVVLTSSLGIPGIVSAQQMCDHLLTTDLAPTMAPPAVPVVTPNIEELVIQIWSTLPLDTLVTNSAASQTHKCALASRLFEVDLMLEDIGFSGYTGTSSPIFKNAFVTYVSDPDDRQVIRDLAFSIIHPKGDAGQRMQDFRANTALFNKNVLNIYFVQYDETIESDYEDYEPIEIRGMHLRNEEGESEKMIFFDDAAVPGTLAHEFGHALSAGHVNFVDLNGDEWCTKFLPQPSTPAGLPDMLCEFTYENIMWAGSDSDRHILGDPQKIRMMRNVSSLISFFSPAIDKLDCRDTNADLAAGCTRLTQ